MGAQKSISVARVRGGFAQRAQWKTLLLGLHRDSLCRAADGSEANRSRLLRAAKPDMVVARWQAELNRFLGDWNRPGDVVPICFGDLQPSFVLIACVHVDHLDHRGRNRGDVYCLVSTHVFHGHRGDACSRDSQSARACRQATEHERAVSCDPCEPLVFATGDVNTDEVAICRAEHAAR
ncbi:MAG: hypothetical protein ACI91B_004135 [Planctomycetota bacterium]|jgi:hypothetical protein